MGKRRVAAAPAASARRGLASPLVEISAVVFLVLVAGRAVLPLFGRSA